MSPKNTLNLADRGSDGHRLRRCRKRPHKADDRKKKKKLKKLKKLKLKKLKLNESEANKSLYICYIEHHPGKRASYVVRSIKLSDLLSSDSEDGLQLRQVAYKGGGGDEDELLPSCVGCGVLGSQIVFAAGLTPAGSFVTRFTGRTWHRDVYVLETDPDKQQQQASMIPKMDAKLLQGKFYPTMTEVGGKLYALSHRLAVGPPSFEVFDPEMGSWSALPQPPFLDPNTKYFKQGRSSWATAGTNMFVCQDNVGPVFCFDATHPDREWRLVKSMRPFPFDDQALVLDLPEDNSNNNNNNNNKLLFACSGYNTYLGAYIMSLDENQESITLIADLKLPMFPEEFDFARRFYLLHIGGQKACLFAPEMCLHEQEPQPEFNEVGAHRTRGIAIPFQFEIDITKINKDTRNCLTLKFKPTRIFEFYTNPSTYPEPEAFGCFLL